MPPELEPVSASPDAVDDDVGAALSVPDSSDSSEGGKLKMIVQLVKKCLGVKDIAAMRLSLPASLLEPVPNLEFSQYLDRPDMFAAINDSDDAFDRMLAVIRFCYTKDLKFVHGKVCKPYNSVLGEHFRAHWDFPVVTYSGDKDFPPVTQSHTGPTAYQIPLSSPIDDSRLAISETDSVKSGRSSKSIRSSAASSTRHGKSPSTAPTSVEGQMSSLSLSTPPTRVVYLTEQISHHPPISAYYASCPSKHISLSGIDQISAKISGTAAVRISPGSANKGIFIDITGGPGQGEQYHITHPIASVNGLLRGNFYVTVQESSIITVKGGKGGLRYRAILEYKEQSWLGRAHYLIEGVVHIVHEGETLHEEWTKVKHVPKNRIVAVFEGSWHGLIRWRKTEYFAAVSSSVSSSPSPSHVHLPTHVPPIESSIDLLKADSSEWSPLIDLEALKIVPKSVRPLEKQLPNESRRLWDGVTTRLLKKEYSEATKVKQIIEQRQRDEASERKRKGVEFVPVYFEKNIESGIPVLTAAGEKVLQEEMVEEPGPLVRSTS